MSADVTNAHSANAAAILDGSVWDRSDFDCDSDGDDSGPRVNASASPGRNPAPRIARRYPPSLDPGAFPTDASLASARTDATKAPEDATSPSGDARVDRWMKIAANPPRAPPAPIAEPKPHANRRADGVKPVTDDVRFADDPTSESRAAARTDPPAASPTTRHSIDSSPAPSPAPSTVANTSWSSPGKIAYVGDPLSAPENNVGRAIHANVATGASNRPAPARTVAARGASTRAPGLGAAGRRT